MPMSQFPGDPSVQATELPHEPAADGTGVAAESPETFLERETLDAKARQGANWFFWVAALSIVNSVISLSEGDRHFVIAMGLTQIVDGIAAAIAQQNAEISTMVRAVAFAISVATAGVAGLFGVLARKGFLAAFVVGMGLYLLDGLLFLLFQDWLSLGFHAFALFGMWHGFTATRSLKAFDEQVAFAGASSQCELPA